MVTTVEDRVDSVANRESMSAMFVPRDRVVNSDRVGGNEHGTEACLGYSPQRGEQRQKKQSRGMQRRV